MRKKNSLAEFIFVKGGEDCTGSYHSDCVEIPNCEILKPKPEWSILGVGLSYGNHIYFSGVGLADRAAITASCSVNGVRLRWTGKNRKKSQCNQLSLPMSDAGAEANLTWSFLLQGPRRKGRDERPEQLKHRRGSLKAVCKNFTPRSTGKLIAERYEMWLQLQTPNDELVVDCILSFYVTHL